MIRRPRRLSCSGAAALLIPALAATSLTLPHGPALAQDRPVALDRPRQAQAPEPYCYCWNDGKKIAEGSMACIRTTMGRRLAVCGRVINMMSWDVSETPCPES